MAAGHRRCHQCQSNGSHLRSAGSHRCGRPDTRRRPAAARSSALESHAALTAAHWQAQGEFGGRASPKGGEARYSGDLRVLVNEAGDVVDLVVNDHVQVLLAGVLGHIRVGELLGGHCCGVFVWRVVRSGELHEWGLCLGRRERFIKGRGKRGRKRQSVDDFSERSVRVRESYSNKFLPAPSSLLRPVEAKRIAGGGDWAVWVVENDKRCDSETHAGPGPGPSNDPTVVHICQAVCIAERKHDSIT